jgi:small subunit ribosomal protein S18
MSDFQSRRPPGGKFGGPGGPKGRKRAKARTRVKKKDPIFPDGARPRPMYIDYKDIEMLKRLINRHGRIVSRRKSGCSAVSQHAVTEAIKRARFMALIPYVGE